MNKRHHTTVAVGSLARYMLEIMQSQYRSGSVNEALVEFVRQTAPEIYDRAESAVKILRPDLYEGDNGENATE